MGQFRWRAYQRLRQESWNAWLQHTSSTIAVFATSNDSSACRQIGHSWLAYLEYCSFSALHSSYPLRFNLDRKQSHPHMRRGIRSSLIENVHFCSFFFSDTPENTPLPCSAKLYFFSCVLLFFCFFFELLNRVPK